MRDIKPQRCVQHHKSLKVTRNATNRDKHINQASQQTIPNNYFKMSCKCTQGLLSNWKICFTIGSFPIGRFSKTATKLKVGEGRWKLSNFTKNRLEVIFRTKQQNHYLSNKNSSFSQNLIQNASNQ